MFRLAHLSDPHLGPLPTPSLTQLASKRVFGYVNWRRNRKGALTSAILDRLLEDLQAQAPHHIAVTGDLVNLALPAEITNAGRWLESLGAAEAVSVVPGNHDAYVPKSRLKAETVWHAYMSGDGTIAAQSTNGPQPRFPYMRRRGPVALIGVNSARATMPLMATGYFRSRQGQQLAELLEAAKAQGLFRVVMIHHPPLRGSTPWHKRLVGASRFRSVIAEHGAELVLHGHTHLDTKNSIEGPSGPVPVICVPSASQGPGKNAHKPPARYNLFDISGEPGNWRCELIERGYERGGATVMEIDRRSLAVGQG